MPEIPTTSLVAATGNNLIFMADMCRRVLLCRLDPGVERPELLTYAFNPQTEAKENRGAYVAAALTIMRAYRCAGMPRQEGQTVQNYSDWCRTVRDALMWLGEADPVASMEEVRKLDPKLDSTQSILAQWRLVIGNRRVTARDIIDAATEQADGPSGLPGRFAHPDFRDSLLSVAGSDGTINVRRLAKWLGGSVGRVIDGRKIMRDGVGHGSVQLWVLEPSAEDVERQAEVDAHNAAAQTEMGRGSPVTRLDAVRAIAVARTAAL